MDSDLLLAVLCGGQSRRMGVDKSLLCYHKDLPQREFFWQLGQALVAEVVFSLNQEQSADSYYSNKNTVVDESPCLGPMAGIVSVMRCYPGWGVLALACDMPGLRVPCLQRLIRQRQRDKFATVYQAAGHWQPLCAIYEAAAAATLGHCLKQGQRSLQQVLRQQPVEIVLASREEEPCFGNINCPNQLGEPGELGKLGELGFMASAPIF